MGARVKILLCNTGRGGEQCIFTSIVHAYRETFPEAEICVATCPQYENLWALNRDHNTWIPIRYEETDKFPGDPVGACHDLMREMMGRFDIIEYPCECNAGGGKALTTLDKCYSCIKNPVFAIEAIERRTFIAPTESDIKKAEDIVAKCSPYVLLSNGANSMKHPLSKDGYNRLSCALVKKISTIQIGTRGGNHMPCDPSIDYARDFRDVGLGVTYLLGQQMKYFIGMETLPTFLMSNSTAQMIIMRGDPEFPITNTGLVNMGFRQPHNTHELEVFGQSDDTIIKTILEIIG